jgi:hypothetical protein
MKNTELVQYVRVERGNKRGQARGVVVAIKDESNGFRLGWSFTKVGAGDVFDKEMGLSIARGRASLSDRDTKSTKVGKVVKIPTSVSAVLKTMRERADRYFKVEA